MNFSTLCNNSHGLLTCAIMQLQIALFCHLNDLNLRNPCKYMYYYSFTNPGERDERLSWPGWQTCSVQFTHKVVTCLYHREGTEKVRRPKTTSHPLSYAVKKDNTFARLWNALPLNVTSASSTCVLRNVWRPISSVVLSLNLILHLSLFLSVGLISWLETVYWTYLIIGFYVKVRFFSVLVIPTCGSSLVNFWVHNKIVLDLILL